MVNMKRHAKDPNAKEKSGGVRRRKKEDTGIFIEEKDEDEEDEESEEESEDDVSNKKEEDKKKRVPKAKGYNWTAIMFLLLFLLPTLFSFVLLANDYLYPDAAKTRVIRDSLVKCYTEVSPDNLAKVDHIIEKYENREHVLFARLRAKYPKVAACNHFG